MREQYYLRAVPQHIERVLDAPGVPSGRLILKGFGLRAAHHTACTTLVASHA